MKYPSLSSTMNTVVSKKNDFQCCHGSGNVRSLRIVSLLQCLCMCWRLLSFSVQSICQLLRYIPQIFVRRWSNSVYRCFKERFKWCFLSLRMFSHLHRSDCKQLKVSSKYDLQQLVHGTLCRSIALYNVCRRRETISPDTKFYRTLALRYRYLIDMTARKLGKFGTKLCYTGILKRFEIDLLLNSFSIQLIKTRLLYLQKID